MTDADNPGAPQTPPEASRLAALVDGAPQGPDAARVLWTEFSAHMDEHRGDFAGFAQKKGWQGVLPEYQRGKAVLVVKTAAPPVAKAAKPPKPKKGPATAEEAAQEQAVSRHDLSGARQIFSSNVLGRVATHGRGLGKPLILGPDPRPPR